MNKYNDFIINQSKNCRDLVFEYADYLRDKVVIDIGSNIGLFARSLAENLPYSQIHLFEPSLEYFNKSKELLKDYKNIVYNNFAVGDLAEEKILYKSDSNIGWNTLYKKDPNQDEKFFEKMIAESVKIVKLDDYYRDIEKIDFIKIDVEGYERNVLEGSWNLIEKFKPYILIEVAWGKNHPDWHLNKKSYEKLFSLGYERFDLDSIEITKDVIFKPINGKNDVTLVTGLWNAGRGNLSGMWNRSFDFYLERFKELLKTDNNLIVFGDNDIKKIVFEHRNEKNTQFIYKDLSDIRKYEYYPLIQKNRNDPNWKFQNDWIAESPLGKMEMAIPIYLSKMVFLNEAIEKSKFNSDFFYHVDGGTRINKENFSKQIVEDISKYTDFFFICFPYVGPEIHGFNYEKANELIKDSVSDIDMVPRGTFFGGHKNNIKSLFSLYYDLMMNTLNQGLMGLDESLFTILMYNHPELIDYYRLEERDEGNPEAFFKRFINSNYKKKLFKKIKKKKKYSEKLPISIGILSWKSRKTLKNTLDSYIKNGLFDIVNDYTIFFQEVSDEDKKIANEYKIPFIGIDQNIGIGKAFIKLTEIARTDNILLLEHDWELIENNEITFKRLEEGIKILNSGYDVIRYRHRKNPGYPLYSQMAYQGKELDNYQEIIKLDSPHLMECIHWIEDPELRFPDKISKNEEYFFSTSRWSNFTNNPCLYKKNFYISNVSDFSNKSQLLENDISYWWARQNFKVAWGEGLFKHNDIEKY